MKRSVSLLALGILMLAGCTAAPSPSPTPTPSGSAARPVDPYIDLLADPEQRSLVAGVEPILRTAGTGPTTFTLTDIPEHAVEIRFFVTCAPDSEFRLTAGSFFAGTCGKHSSFSGSIPIPPGRPLDVTLEVSEGTHFRVLGLPVPREKVIQ